MREGGGKAGVPAGVPAEDSTPSAQLPPAQCTMQEVEYVKAEAKLVYLLECLQKTAPPVLVFAEKTADVDDIHEYLLVKGVEAVAVHGGKDQEDREAAIDAFKVCLFLGVGGRGLGGAAGLGSRAL